MIRLVRGLITFFYVGSICTLCADYQGQDDTFPFAPSVGEVGSSAIDKDNASIVAWASGYEGLVYGGSVAQQWKTPVKALGPAAGDSFDVVSLGSGGQITLTFTNPIRDGSGPDFAVFENAFSDTFLELAWVEVSTDGVHFVRFPNFSYTADLTGSVDPTFVHGLASKYRQGYGTPFDLEQLTFAYEAALAEADTFSGEYEQQLEDNYPYLDLQSILYVRVIDIIGDGRSLDSEGAEIYDPYPTSGSAGMDLDAVGVLNSVTGDGLEQSIEFPAVEHRRLVDGVLTLNGTASSGLPVSYQVLEGPAELSDATLSFSGYGQVVVQAVQVGDGTFAAATPVTHSFHVAEELQHIYFEPVANQTVGSSISLNAQTTSGFIPIIEVVEGPSDVSAGFPLNQTLQTGSSVGKVILRAYQVGGTLDGVTYAPANDVIMELEVVSLDSNQGPVDYTAWQSMHSISETPDGDSDFDGASNYEEYAAGSNPVDPADRPSYILEALDGEYQLAFAVNRQAPVRVLVEHTSDLQGEGSWSEFLPEIVQGDIDPDDSSLRRMKLKVSDGTVPEGYWRVRFLDNN